MKALILYIENLYSATPTEPPLGSIFKKKLFSTNASVIEMFVRENLKEDSIAWLQKQAERQFKHTWSTGYF